MHREDAQQHDAYLEWLQGVINSDEAFGLSEFVLSGFVRVATHSKVFKTPSPIAECDRLRGSTARAAQLCADQYGSSPLEHLHAPVRGKRCQGESVSGRVSRGARDRVRLRMGELPSGLQPLLRFAVAPPA